MNDKNTKLTAAARLGRKINFWRRIERWATKLDCFAVRKLEGYTQDQDELLVEILNDERKEAKTV